MDKNQIVEELYRSKEFNDCIGKMEPEHLQDDLRAEVTLILLETDEARLRAIHANGGLKFYTVRIILNLIQSKTSVFYKRYRQQLLEINEQYVYEQTDLEERLGREETEENVLKEIENLYWYNRDIIKLYMKHGNYRAIQQLTKIPYSSAYKTIQKSFEIIKQKVSK